jgi:hypothetical protein
MTKDEALRLALEALKKSEPNKRSGDDDYREIGWMEHREAITACEATLVNEALERKAENARELGLDYEPVAYVETKEVHGQMCSFIYRSDSTKLLPDGTKLYATTPQRKPLTDEEITEIFSTTKGLDFYLNFARAIEAAHEIKEKN